MTKNININKLIGEIKMNKSLNQKEKIEQIESTSFLKTEDSSEISNELGIEDKINIINKKYSMLKTNLNIYWNKYA